MKIIAIEEMSDIMVPSLYKVVFTTTINAAQQPKFNIIKKTTTNSQIRKTELVA